MSSYRLECCDALEFMATLADAGYVAISLRRLQDTAAQLALPLEMP